ncbi:uncharacterized protein N7529_010592, partial [Penicillium soppii]|uniref:uncharacterized protein n=1 Tax=Penicillium soppii TaxID=69789 RepID=UPI002546A633
SCTCHKIKYELRLASDNEARTSLCHYRIHQNAFGTEFGSTSKVPGNAFHISNGLPREHAADNGSAVMIHREFCNTCGSFILEYEEAVNDYFRYISVETLDDPEALPPQGGMFLRGSRKLDAWNNKSMDYVIVNTMCAD